VTCTLSIINPKSFDVAYTLGWNVDDSLFTSKPTTTPTASDATHLSFSFALAPTKAERKTVTFSLGKYVAPPINKTYTSDTFSVVCESPPDPPARVATLIDKSQKSILAILLPTGTADGDLSKLQITWTKEGASAESGTYSISSLQSAPASNPFSSTYDCYFQSSDVVAGYGYSYSVVLLNAEGIASSAATTSSTANLFYLNYNGNGNTVGAAPASVGYRYGATATVASPGTLARTNYAFSKWNTAADGTGISYSPGDTLTIPAGETTLYAQWLPTDGISATIYIPTPGSITFSGTVTVAKGVPLALTVGESFASYQWYMDGNELSGMTSQSISINTSTYSVGVHRLTVVVYDSSGVSSSATETVRITN
jgi:uncharacterized repeat protein (TIGR02543 family)